MSDAQTPQQSDLDKISDAIDWMPKGPGTDRVKLETLEWLPSGPVARAFVLAPEPVTLICGPWGSGKTTALFVKLLLCSCAVPPSPVDGVRYARVVVIRDTYRNLETNTIPSWNERFPKDMGKWKGGGGGEPGAHVIDFQLEDGSTLHWEVLFVAVGDHNVKQFCDGLQVNAAALNGADELPADLVSYLDPRIGRWPPPQHRPPDWKSYVRYWCKIMGDMNAPELDNWTVKLFSDQQLPGYKLFLQPGGNDPGAENMENLRDGYYTSMAIGKEDWWIKRFIDNKFGFSRTGMPVYQKFDEAVHLSKKPLIYNPKRKLVLGGDGGKDACIVAMQREFSGRIAWLKEFIPPQRMAAKQFGAWFRGEFDLWTPKLGEFEIVLDPAAFDPNTLDSDVSWAEMFARAFGLDDEWKDTVKQAATNDLDVRLEAVASPLREVDGFALDCDACPVLRRAFNSGYKFGDSKTHGDAINTNDPVKNQWSHPMEAGQYGNMRLLGMRAIAGRPRRRSHREPVVVDFNPHEMR